MEQRFDVIVVGLGAMGSAATYQLARRGARVLALEQHWQGHKLGSSHGHHRMIRRSAPRPELEPFIARAFELWRELEADSGQNIMNLIGEVTLKQVQPTPASDTETEQAQADTAVASDLLQEADQRTPVLESAVDRMQEGIRQRWGGQVQILERAELRERFPGFRRFPEMIATFEEEAGYLRPEVAIAVQRELAERYGAEWHDLEPASNWRADGDGVRVETPLGTYTADRLVLTPGPWAPELLRELNLPLEVQRIVNVYFQPQRTDWWTAERGAPDFLLDVEEGSFYGMPSIERLGVKIGRHDNGQATTAESVNRDVSQDEIDVLRGVLDKYMPGSTGRVLQTITCMYTMTPDEQYIIDRYPQYPQALYACGFSGTGFKFSCVVGQVLAELTLDGKTRFDIDFLAARRFTAVESVSSRSGA